MIEIVANAPSGMRKSTIATMLRNEGVDAGIKDDVASKERLQGIINTGTAVTVDGDPFEVNRLEVERETSS